MHTPDTSPAKERLEFPFQPPTPDGSVVQVAPGILWARMPMPMSLDHINVYMLREDDGWTLIDTGLNLDSGKALWEQIVAEHFEGLPVKRLICTHCHYDHSGLAKWITEHYDVPLLMTYGEYFMLRSLMSTPPPEPLPASERVFFLRAGMADERIDQIFARMRKDPFMPPFPHTYERVREGDVLRIGDRDWRVIVGEGHSPEHACLFCERDNILIAGDQLLPRITSSVLVTAIEPEGNPLQLWLASLDCLDVLPPETLVLPSHERVFRGLHARVEELHAHHNKHFDTLLQTIAQAGSATALELMHSIFTKLRSPTDELMALGETVAHLSCLRHTGRLTRVLDDDGCYRFSLPR